MSRFNPEAEKYPELSAAQLKTLKRRYYELALLYIAKHPEDLYPEQVTDFAFHDSLAKEKAQRFEDLAAQLGQPHRSNAAVIQLLGEKAEKIGAKLHVSASTRGGFRLRLTGK